MGESHIHSDHNGPWPLPSTYLPIFNLQQLITLSLCFDKLEIKSQKFVLTFIIVMYHLIIFHTFLPSSIIIKSSISDKTQTCPQIFTKQKLLHNLSPNANSFNKFNCYLVPGIRIQEQLQIRIRFLPFIPHWSFPKRFCQFGHSYPDFIISMVYILCKF